MIYWFIPDGQRAALPEMIAPYRCVVLIERPVDDSFRNDVSRQLVSTGCRYMMAWGHDCSRWDDSVDWADLERFGFGDIPPEHFVMTTWHVGQTLEEVFDYAKRHALLAYDDAELKSLLVLDIGNRERQAEIEKLYEQA